MKTPIIGTYCEKRRHINMRQSRRCRLWGETQDPPQRYERKYLRGLTNISNAVNKTFSYSVEILAMVSQELYSTPVKISLHCAVRTPLSQSPVVRKVVMSTLLWSRRRFDGLQEKKTSMGEIRIQQICWMSKFDPNIIRNFQTSCIVPVYL